jgi:PTH1 family peptidyl-tRNA hydrolase
MKYLIVGLGNIGQEYVETRHNIGFDIVTVLANKHQVSFVLDKYAMVCECKLKGKTLLLIKPTTYMNLSGRAVKYWMDKEKIQLENILVVVDDLAFPLTVNKLKGSGSDAGHNGLKSIQESIGTQNYAKLRFGIGNDFAKGRQADFVLSKWADKEIPLVNQKVDACVTCIEDFVLQGLSLTMNNFNKLKFEE